jgi:hypothetical protein
VYLGHPDLVSERLQTWKLPDIVGNGWTRRKNFPLTTITWMSRTQTSQSCAARTLLSWLLSALMGATREGIVEAAREDYWALVREHLNPDIR